jgi:hypothetical protein
MNFIVDSGTFAYGDTRMHNEIVRIWGLASIQYNLETTSL